MVGIDKKVQNTIDKSEVEKTKVLIIFKNVLLMEQK